MWPRRPCPTPAAVARGGGTAAHKAPDHVAPTPGVGSGRGGGGGGWGGIRPVSPGLGAQRPAGRPTTHAVPCQ